MWLWVAAALAGPSRLAPGEVVLVPGHDGKHVVTASLERVSVRDLDTGAVVFESALQDGRGWRLDRWAWRLDARGTLWTVTSEGALYAWDRDGRQGGPWNAPFGGSTDLDSSADGQTLWVEGRSPDDPESDAARVWSVDPDAWKPAILPAGSVLVTVAPGGRWALVDERTAWGGAVSVVDPSTGAVVRTLQLAGNDLVYATFGQNHLVVESAAHLEVFRVDDWTRIHHTDGESEVGGPGCLTATHAVLADNRLLGTDLRILELASGREVALAVPLRPTSPPFVCTSDVVVVMTGRGVARYRLTDGTEVRTAAFRPR